MLRIVQIDFRGGSRARIAPTHLFERPVSYRVSTWFTVRDLSDTVGWEFEPAL